MTSEQMEALRAGVALLPSFKAKLESLGIPGDRPLSTISAYQLETIIAALSAVGDGVDPIQRNLIDRVKRLTKLFMDEPTEELLSTLKDAKLRLAEHVLSASPSLSQEREGTK